MITRAQGGDPAAFEAIYTAYRVPLLKFCRRTMHDADDAEEVVADTFLKAWLALPSTSEDLRIGPWLYRIAGNRCLDLLRRRRLVTWHPLDDLLALAQQSRLTRLHALLVDHEPPPERLVERAELEAEVRTVLDALPARYRLALHLREYLDCTYDEIAEYLGTTRAAVKSHLFRARGLARELWTAHEAAAQAAPAQEGQP